MGACVGVFVFPTSTIFLCYLDNRGRVERSQCRGTDQAPPGTNNPPLLVKTTKKMDFNPGLVCAGIKLKVSLASLGIVKLAN